MPAKTTKTQKAPKTKATTEIPKVRKSPQAGTKTAAPAHAKAGGKATPSRTKRSAPAAPATKKRQGRGSPVPAAPEARAVVGAAAPGEIEALRQELEVLREENRELGETLDAIRSGEVDAIIVPDRDTNHIYTLEGPDQPYRDLVENIREGALTLARDGTILYANARFSEMTGRAPETIPGDSFMTFVCPDYRAGVAASIDGIRKNPFRNRVRLHRGTGSVPVFLSMSPLTGDMGTKISVVVADRRQDEEELRLKARMLEAAGDAVIARDPSGKIIYWNPAATKTYGWEETEVLGRNLGILTQEGKETDARAILSQLRKGESWAGEYFAKHKDGHTFPIYVRDSPVFNEDGKIVAFVGVSKDISERKAAEIALREKNKEIAKSEEKLHQKNEELAAVNEEMASIMEELRVNNEELAYTTEELRQTNMELARGEAELRLSEQKQREQREFLATVIDNAGSCIAVVQGKDLLYTMANPAFEAYAGRPMVGLTYREVFPKAAEAGSEKILREVLKTGKPWEVDDYNAPVPGKPDATWQGRVVRLPLVAGEEPAALAVVWDITDRKRSGEALRQSEELLRAVTDNSPDAIYVKDRESKWLMANPAVLGIVRKTAAEVQGKTDRDLYADPAIGTAILENDRRIMEEGRTETIEEIADTPQGRRTFLSIKAPRRNAEGMIIGLVGISHDITERKETEEMVRRSRDELEQRVKERTAELKTALETVGTERQRFFDVLETLPAMVCLITADYHIEFANRMFREKFGESEGRHCYDYCFGQKEPCSFCESLRPLETGKPHQWEVNSPDGSIIAAYDFPFTDADGSRMVLEMDIDITDQRHAENVIRQVAAYNRTLIEASPDPLVTIRPDGTIGDVNEATVRATGVSREEMIGTDFSEYFTDPLKAKEGYEKIFKYGAVRDYALEIRHRDGSRTPVVYNATVFRDETGKVAGVFAAARDVTDIRRAEAALLAAIEDATTERKRLYDVLETLPVYVCLLDKDYRMPFANRYFRETFGYSDRKCCYDFLFNLRQPCDGCETYTVMKTKAPHHWFWTGPNKRDYSIYDFPFYDTDGSLLILEMGIDITEQNQAERALRKARDELEDRVRERTTELEVRNEELGALNEELTAAQETLRVNNEELVEREREISDALAEKEVLLSEIHHRVKNNLTAFISLLSLEGAYDNTPAGIALKTDLQNRARSMALIHETLYRTKNFSKVDMQTYLTTLMGQVAGSYSRPVPVRTVVHAEGITLDLGRATPMGLIVNELITNALKYAFPAEWTRAHTASPEITVLLERAGNDYILQVKDNGIGLPPDIDIAKTKSLGLKLVNFLARHQLQAEIGIHTEGGTEFIFRVSDGDRFS